MGIQVDVKQNDSPMAPIQMQLATVREEPTLRLLRAIFSSRECKCTLSSWQAERNISNQLVLTQERFAIFEIKASGNISLSVNKKAQLLNKTAQLRALSQLTTCKLIQREKFQTRTRPTYAVFPLRPKRTVLRP